jgi:uncharacterized protein YgbK (DUF1537 family)
MTEDTGPRVIVLDDDPTGTQTVADLPVVLRPDRETLARAAGQRPGPVWVLTNTRAMTAERARITLGEIARDVRSVFGQAACLVLRGDSTLRGHVLAEIDTLSSPGSVALFVPAFIEQGRVGRASLRREPRHDLAYAQHADSSGYCRTLASAVADSLASRRVVVLSTPRDTRPGAMTFAAGEAIMDSVVATVRLLRGTFAALVTKGGITSARVARDALGVSIAYVRGQVLPGIPAWELSCPPGGGIGQVIVPGNVGQPSAINQIVDQLTGARSWTPTTSSPSSPAGSSCGSRRWPSDR